jgi:hypothetical protein
MRFGIGLLAVAFVVFVGAQSYAQTFPALPGMNTVAKATHNQAPSTSRSVSGSSSSTPSHRAPAPSLSGAAKSSAKTQDLSPITRLPGAGSLPIIKDYRTAARSRGAMPDVLFLLAAIGTATSLGMLWAVRKRFERSDA